MRKKVVVDWANLEELPLSLILDKLEEHIDHVRFSVVCKRWLSIANLNHQNHLFRINIPPMLMIFRYDFYSRKTKIPHKGGLYGILSQKEYPILQFTPPNFTQIKKCHGFTHGWLPLVYDNNAITLVHPFKSGTPPISLPPLELVFKIILSADPITSPNDYVVGAIYSGMRCLAFKRPCQTFWIFIDTNEIGFNSFLFHKGLILADKQGSDIVTYKLNNSNYEKIANIPYNINGDIYHYCIYTCLGKSLTGDIWMVRRQFEPHDFSLHKISVYELKLDAQSGRLKKIVRLESLKDNILFVELGVLFSVSASYFSNKLEKDSIYFVNHRKDVVIYNAKDGSYRTEPLPPSIKFMPLYWVMPQFQWN